MAYKPCRNCEFWVAPQDKHCLNCGIFKPQSDRKFKSFSNMVIGGCLGGILGGVIGVGISASKGGILDGSLSGILKAIKGMVVGTSLGASVGASVGAGLDGQNSGIVGGCIGSALGLGTGWFMGGDSGAIIGWFVGAIFGPIVGLSIHGGVDTVVSRVIFRHQPRFYLRRNEQIIRQRLEELKARERQIVAMQQRIEQEITGEQWQRVHEVLEKGAETLRLQSEHYRAKLWEISMLRWQNTLEPLVDEWDNLTYEECGRRLKALTATCQRGEITLQEWKQTDLATTPDGQSYIMRLQEVLTACEQLRQALLAQQALLAVKGITPLEETSQSIPKPSAALEQFELFHTRVTLGEFSSAFTELESEYIRLQNEEEIAQQVKQILE